MKAIAVLILVLPPVLCYSEKLKIKDLPIATGNELQMIFNQIDLVPDCENVPRPSKPNYLLYNRDNKEKPVLITGSNVNEIKEEKNTIVLIPGWLTVPNNFKILDLKNAYLLRYDCNLIVVDWSKHAFEPYTSVYCGVKMQGLNIADFLCSLEWESENVAIEEIHIVGHNIGGQIAGFVGKYTDFECDRKIGRITGLDPAGPLFNFESNDEKLSKEDALFVDIIHTHYQFGTLKYSGHADFYVNCYFSQPGCPEIFEINNDTLVYECYCPSLRSIELMSESVNSNQLIAVSCSSCDLVCEPDIITEVYAVMGEDCREKPQDAHNFLVYTGDKYPYGLGMLPYP